MAKVQLLLEMNADRALFEKKIDGIVATCYSNERPLRGLAGLLDWRTGGIISEYLRSGIITGAMGECTYLPLRRNGHTYHLFLLGCGHAVAPGRRDQVPETSVEAIRDNILKLKLEAVGISQTDFGGQGKDYFSQEFKGVPVWIVQ